jgi:hypothetical protein
MCMCVTPKAIMDGEFRNQRNKAPERSVMVGSWEASI